jgi:hypothetical protein
MMVITGMRTNLLNCIEQVNAHIDQTASPCTISDYMVWNTDNPTTWKHPGYTDEDMANTMDDLAAKNAAQEVQCLKHECFYATLMIRYIAKKRFKNITDDAYIDKWNEVCRNIFKSMGWPHMGPLSSDMDNTIVNAWRQAEDNLDLESWNMSTSFIFERIMGKKPNTLTPEGHKAFNDFTTKYNSFCAEQNFNAADGFPKSQDGFFKFYLANKLMPTAPETQAQPPKTV